MRAATTTSRSSSSTLTAMTTRRPMTPRRRVTSFRAAMADVSYVPGNRTAIVGDCCWLLIDAAPDSAAVSEIWRCMEQAPQLDALVASLLRFGFDHVPDFVLLVAAEGRHQLICRGRASASLIADELAQAGRRYRPGHLARVPGRRGRRARRPRRTARRHRPAASGIRGRLPRPQRHHRPDGHIPQPRTRRIAAGRGGACTTAWRPAAPPPGLTQPRPRRQPAR